MGGQRWRSATEGRAIYGNTADAKAQPGTYLLTGNSAWTDYTVSVRMRTEVDDDAMGVMFGYQGPGNYYRFSMDRQRANRRLVKFVNGAATVTETRAPSGVHASDAANAMRIGAASWGEYFSGVMDEVRISKAIRSAGWIRTTYNTIRSPGSFISVGGQESQ